MSVGESVGERSALRAPVWTADRRLWIGVAVLAIAGLALRLVLVSRPLPVLDRLFIPDDTYYTLTIARSIAHGHGPTVDGSTLTSGFQPLLGFLLVPVFWLTNSPDLALRVDLVFLAVIDSVTILVVAWVAARLAGGIAALVAAAIWALSPVAISMAIGGLETSLAICMQVALVALWMRARERDDTWHWAAVGLFAGLAVLARIDSLALVALLAAVQLWRGSRRGLITAAITALVVLAPWWGWCIVTFGTPVPTSGAVHKLALYGSFSREDMALAAGAVTGSPFGVWNQARGRLVHHWLQGVFVFWVFVVALVGIAIASVRASFRAQDQAAWAIVPALPAFAACLLLFYAWFGITWYYTRYLAPVAWIVTLMLSVGVATAVRGAGSRRGARITKKGVAVVSAACIAALLLVAARADLGWATRQRRRPDIAQPTSYLDAGTGYRAPVRMILQHVPRGSRIAGWQSGALGYYGVDRTVINLDGAVNPDLADAGSAEIARYLRQRRVGGLADFGLVVYGLGTKLGRLRPPPRIEPGSTVRGDGPMPAYSYIRIIWPHA